MEFDIVLRGGLVFDGLGGAPRRTDVGVRDGVVATVDDLAAAAAPVVLDVAGKAVAPGFVDSHAHTDLAGLLPEEHAAVKSAGILQGVTTEVCGNCGFSPFPAPPGAVDPNDPYLGRFGRDGVGYFASLAEYRDTMSAYPMFANLAPLVGHGRIRSTVMGDEARPPTSDELAELERLVAEAMDHGAFGISSGLIYAPGVYADTEELIAVARVAARYDRPYTTHMRDEGDFVEDAVAEAVRIGREAGARVEISHHKVAGRQNWGRSQATLGAIEAARASGIDVGIDVYPYTAGSTFLAALLPPWVHEGGPSRLHERLRDPVARERMTRDFAQGLPGWQSIVNLAQWENVVVAGDVDVAGTSIGALAAEQKRSEVEVMGDLLAQDSGAMVIVHMMEDAEVVSIGDQPFAAVGSDGVPAPGTQHPRLAGSFARVLARHRADPMALADAVRRMTSLPASRFGLGDRGVVATGKAADLVVFDPETVQDRATYTESLLPPVGVVDVLVGGQVVVRDGKLTGARPGRILAAS